MTLSEGDKAIVKETAWEVADAVAARIQTDVAALVKLHAASCPVKDKVEEIVNKGKGAWAAVIVVAGAVGSLVALVVGHFWK